MTVLNCVLNCVKVGTIFEDSGHQLEQVANRAVDARKLPQRDQQLRRDSRYSQEEEARTRYGLADYDGVLFQSKKVFRPLHAADILAWQMHNHMRKVILPGCQPHEELARSHPGFSRIFLKKLKNITILLDDGLGRDTALSAGRVDLPTPKRLQRNPRRKRLQAAENSHVDN